MGARLTVVLDDEDLYRQAKVYAAHQGIPLKSVIEEALRSYLRGDRGVGEVPIGEEKRFDPDRFDMWIQLAEALGEELGPGPTNRADVKAHIYGPTVVAEERAPYEA
jgi:hypothetical protein